VNAVTLHETELRIEERPTPVPGAGEVLVRIHAAGLNAADLLQRRGHYSAPAGWPADIPGLELAGVVESIGEGVGDSLLSRRVCAIVGGGAQATHALVPASHLVTVPDHVSWEQAGGFAESFFTAFDALVRQADLRSGERVLISGAAGGVGNAAVQIARLRGAHVIAAVRTLNHGAALRTLGAHEVCTIEQVNELAPVDVVLELVGEPHFTRAQHRLAPFARVVVIGVGAGAKVECDLRILMATRGRIMGSTMRGRSIDEKALITKELTTALASSWENGDVTVPVARTFPLAEVNAAYDYFATPGKFGKVILTMDES